MDQELYDLIQKLQHDSYFRTRSEGRFDRIVNSPYIGAPLASAFERITRCADPVVEMGRLGIHEVHSICWSIDAVEDSLDLIGNIPLLTRDGAITVRRMAGGRC